MEKIKSKDILIILIGIILIPLIGLTYKSSIISFKNEDIIIVFILSIIGVVIILWMKNKELWNELKEHKELIKRNNERLKIYERLSRLEAEVFKK